MFERVYGTKQIELAQAILSGKAPITCDTMACHHQTLAVNAWYSHMRRSDEDHGGRAVFVPTAYSKLWAEAVMAGKMPPRYVDEPTPVGGHKTI